MSSPCHPRRVRGVNPGGILTNRRTAGVALLGAVGLLLSSLAVTAGPAQAAPLSITATPTVVVNGQMITVKGNAGKAWT